MAKSNKVAVKADQDIGDILNFENAVVTERMFLPVGKYLADIIPNESGELEVNVITLDDGANAGKQVFLLPISVQYSGETVKGDVSFASAKTFEAAQKALAGNQKVMINVTHSKKGDCYCNLMSELQTRVYLASVTSELLATAEKKKDEKKKDEKKEDEKTIEA